MGDLSIGLALLGTLLLVGVLFHAFWKNAHKRKIRKMLSAEGSGEAQGGAGRVASASVGAHSSPSPANTSPDAATGQDGAAQSGALPEHVLRSADVSSHVAMEGDTAVLQVPQTRVDDYVPMLERPRTEKHLAIDSFIDAIANIPLKQTFSGDVLLPLLPSVFRCGNKPFLVEGLNNRSDVWEFLQSKQHYRQLRCAIQRANRHGAMNEIEFSEFAQKAQTLADQVDSDVDLPDMLEEVAKARNLDKMAAESDFVMTFFLRSVKTPWTLGLVQHHAVAIGFVQGFVANTLVMPARFSAHTVIMSLDFCRPIPAYDVAKRNELELPYFSISLDVPQVQKQEGAYTVLCRVAQQLANALQGEVVDDEGHAISAQAMDVIQQQLDQIYTTLSVHGVAAGSSVARRLFN